jgi:DNA-binding transcriptional MerR regulator
VPVPTIKYYLREGLLPPGERTAVNQASYDQRHLHRLRLIRVLREVADLGIATIKDILDAVGDQRLGIHELLGLAHRSLGPKTPEHDDEALAQAGREVDAFLDRLGWRVSPDAPARTTLAQTLLSLRRLGHQVGPQVFAEYAEAADRIAAWELAHVASADSREDQVEQVVVGTVIYETALVALRRLAEEHHSAMQFAPPATGA